MLDGIAPRPADVPMISSMSGEMLAGPAAEESAAADAEAAESKA